MRDAIEYIGEVLVPGLLVTAFMIVVVAIPTVAIATYTDSISCKSLAEQNPHLEFRYTFWTGCLVRTPSGNWIDSENMYLLENWED